MQRWHPKVVVNMLTLATPLGLLIGALGRCDFSRGPRGLIIAAHYRRRFPSAGAFTVGNVILTGHDDDFLLSRPVLLAHEERHTWQYVACLGLPFLPLYLLASAWSLARGGDAFVHNMFERHAGLAEGGYPLISARQQARQRREQRPL